MKRWRPKLILDILDRIFLRICSLFDWIEHKIIRESDEKT